MSTEEDNKEAFTKKEWCIIATGTLCGCIMVATNPPNTCVYGHGCCLATCTGCGLCAADCSRKRRLKDAIAQKDDTP